MAAMSAFSLSGHTLALFTPEVVFWLCEVLVTAGSHVTVDSRGYILYCPCNGECSSIFATTSEIVLLH